MSKAISKPIMNRSDLPSWLLDVYAAPISMIWAEMMKKR